MKGIPTLWDGVCISSWSGLKTPTGSRWLPNQKSEYISWISAD